MLAKPNSRSQLTLPKSVTAAIGPTEYFDVVARDGLRACRSCHDANDPTFIQLATVGKADFLVTGKRICWPWRRASGAGRDGGLRGRVRVTTVCGNGQEVLGATCCWGHMAQATEVLTLEINRALNRHSALGW